MTTQDILTYASLTIIGLSGVSILAGVALVLSGRQELHKKAMLTATMLASVFVVLYLVKSSLYPPVKYAGDHRKLYFFILGSHTILAALNLPLAAYTVYLGLKDKLDKHKRIAPFTAAVWIYVAVTGWAIYFILH